MPTLEQQYYEMLARTDHPVYARDLSLTTDANSPFNSQWNRLMAKQLVRMRTALDSLQANNFPHTVDVTGIDQWEETYFGFTKPQYDLNTRVAQLLQKINSTIGMRVSDVITTVQALTGQTPQVIRSLYDAGWVLDQSVLDVSTILPSGVQATDSQIYFVIISQAIDSAILVRVDKELSKIEKGGSVHGILVPIISWVLSQGALDTDSILGLNNEH